MREGMLVLQAGCRGHGSSQALGHSLGDPKGWVPRVHGLSAQTMLLPETRKPHAGRMGVGVLASSSCRTPTACSGHGWRQLGN